MKRKLIYYLLAGAMIIQSCSDSDIPGKPADKPQIAVDADEIRLPVRASYHTVKVSNAGDAAPSGLTAGTSADWITLLADTVGSDGYVEIYVGRNEEPAGRSGSLMIGGQDCGSVEVPVYQCGLSDDGNNGGLTSYAGCGYNIFQELNSESSICNPIIDYDKAVAVDPMLVQTVARHMQDVKTLTSNSATEMSDIMTHTVEKTRSGLMGGKKTVMRFETNAGNTRADITNHTYINLQRIAACSSLDFSKVIQYAGSNADIFTDEFRRMYDEIIESPTQENVFRLFKEFGTHIVTYVDLGGTMDIALSFNKTMIGELNMRADDFRKYFFEWNSSDYTLNMGDSIQGLSSSVKKNGTFKIAGGSHDARQAILNDCEQLGRIRPEHIIEWSKSLPENNFLSDESLSRLAPLNVQLVPVWSVFPQHLAGLFFECAVQESQKSHNAIDDAKGGLDSYGFSIDRADFMTFTEDDKSLVRVVYANQSNIRNAAPVLEICNEYVPVLKGNERITVIYPIRYGRPFHGTGLFPGDGKGCAPAWLTFSDGEVYVSPVDGADSFSKIDSVYYLHGNIYLSSLGLNLRKDVKTAWKSKGVMGVPIVKIGSGYWTRQNITSSINSGVMIGNYFRKREFLTPGGEVWVNISNQLYNPPAGVGDDIDHLYDKPTKWYFPTDADREDLQEYIGHDTRHLFKGQQTGFDAQFEGYYGVGGVDGVWQTDREKYHNVDKCYLAFKTHRTSDTGVALCLDPNYKWRKVLIGNGSNNVFPVRLFRSSYYIYKNYNDANDNL